MPARRTPDGLRALSKDRPIDPGSVRRYLETRFGDGLGPARAAMTALASAFEPDELAERGYALYESFRPEIVGAKRGWGAAGRLDLRRIRSLAHR